ncbi:hypothetical protein LCGC14_0378710 [marine sediment metagenome]|uniref:Uncharacterized protein n=1 Tax=marine sediment metagenome TaxID=412755 RepID=A0A0F9WBR5_9ZZZZ
MKVTNFKDSDKQPWTMVEATEDEALKIIESIADQLRHHSSNVGRREFPKEDGGYFSIAVVRP